jgi:hypothetical protein
MSFLISVTVAAAANDSEVKNKSSHHKGSHHKGSHVAKKVKTALDPDIAKTALDPDIAAGKTELTPLQANKYNLGDYAGSSTTIDTPDGASNTINMGVNSGIQFDDGPHPGNKIMEGDHVGGVFNFGSYPGITFDNAPKKGISSITTNPKIGPEAGVVNNSGTNAETKTYAGKYLNQTYNNTMIL